MEKVTRRLFLRATAAAYVARSMSSYVFANDAAGAGRAVSSGCLSAREGLGDVVCAAVPDVRTLRFGQFLGNDPEAIRFVKRLIERIVDQADTQMGLIARILTYDDGISPNALATSYSDLPWSNGTIFLGVQLINDSLSKTQDARMVLAGIMAHEIAHLYQFKNGFCSPLLCGGSAAKVELHADFIAGFALNRLALSVSSVDAGNLAAGWQCLGDNSFTRCDHHGTPPQRLACLREGYALASRSGTTFDMAARDGANYVGSLLACTTTCSATASPGVLACAG